MLARLSAGYRDACAHGGATSDIDSESASREINIDLGDEPGSPCLSDV